MGIAFTKEIIMEKELISVVVITYKRKLDVLSRAIKSVLNQSYANLELIVVNDAPEEVELEKQIKGYIDSADDRRIKYILHEKNMGANYARNTGLENANGKYIAYLDDDDEWLSNKIELQYEAIKDKTNVGMVYSGFYIRENSGDTKREVIIPKNYLKALVEDNYIGSTSFPLLRTEAVRMVGGFDVNQKSCQEYELWIRIAKQYDIIGIPNTIGVYYMSNDSTFKGNYNSYVSGDNALINKHKDLFEKYPIQYSNHLLHMFTYMIKEKQYKIAFTYKCRAINACWYNIKNLSIAYVLFMFAKRTRKSKR